MHIFVSNLKNANHTYWQKLNMCIKVKQCRFLYGKFLFANILRIKLH